MAIFHIQQSFGSRSHCGCMSFSNTETRHVEAATKEEAFQKARAELMAATGYQVLSQRLSPIFHKGA